MNNNQEELCQFFEQLGFKDIKLKHNVTIKELIKASKEELHELFGNQINFEDFLVSFEKHKHKIKNYEVVSGISFQFNFTSLNFIYIFLFVNFLLNNILEKFYNIRIHKYVYQTNLFRFQLNNVSIYFYKIALFYIM